MNYNEIINKIRISTGDYSETRNSNADIKAFINEGQREYAQRTGCLTGIYQVIGSESGIYKLPDDFIYPIEIRNIHNEQVKGCSFKQIDYNNDFLIIQDSYITAIFFDYESDGHIRVYPNLSEGVLGGYITYARKSIDDVLEIPDFEAVIYYALHKIYEKERDRKLLQKSINNYEKFLSRVYKYDKTESNKTIKGGAFF